MSQDELAHHVLPRDGVLHSLVVENEDGSGQIDKKTKLPKTTVTDFITYYSLPS